MPVHIACSVRLAKSVDGNGDIAKPLEIIAREGRGLQHAGTIRQHDQAARVFALNMGDSAHFIEQFRSVAHPQNRRVDAVHHAIDSVQPLALMFLALAFGDVPIRAPISHDEPLCIDDRERLAFQPTVRAVLVLPARGERGKPLILGVKRAHRAGDHHLILLVHALKKMGAQDGAGLQAQDVFEPGA
jgi:hypothetical protein